jgi:hypothetical protein
MTQSCWLIIEGIESLWTSISGSNLNHCRELWREGGERKAKEREE